MSKRAEKFVEDNISKFHLANSKGLANILEQFLQESMPTDKEIEEYFPCKPKIPPLPNNAYRGQGAFWCKNFVREEKPILGFTNKETEWEPPRVTLYHLLSEESQKVTDRWIREQMKEKPTNSKDRYIVAITYVMMSSDGTPFDIDSPILSDIEIPILSVNIKHKFKQAKQFVILREEWAEDMFKAMDQAKNKLTEGIHNKIEVISVSALKL